MWQLYRPPGDVVAGALLVGAGVYELTPLKRECRRRCRERQHSGLRFGAYCFGSSIGLMLALVAIDVMSVLLMCAVAGVVLAQKLLAPQSRCRRALGTGDRRRRCRCRRNLRTTRTDP